MSSSISPKWGTNKPLCYSCGNVAVREIVYDGIQDTYHKIFKCSKSDNWPGDKFWDEMWICPFYTTGSEK